MQAFILTLVISLSLYNLTVGSDKERETFWASILSACVGLAIPGPLIQGRNDTKKSEVEKGVGSSLIEITPVHSSEIRLDHNVSGYQSSEQ